PLSPLVTFAGGSELAPPRLLHDPHAGACADARRAGGDHRLQALEITDATCGLDAHLLADHAPHERNISRGGAAWATSSGGLDVIRAGGLRQRARGDLLIVGEQRRLDDDLAERPRFATRKGDRLDVALDNAQLTRFQCADVDDHVDLSRAIENRAPRLIV